MRPHFFLLLTALLFKGTPALAQACQPQELIEACKMDLEPYSYSNSRSVMTDKAASREISVTLLSEEKYRLVFNVTRLPEEAVVRIYDGPQEDSGRDLLMSSKDVPANHDRFVYEPPQKVGEEIYVSYEIPDVDRMSCFTFVVGYKLSYKD